MVKYEEPVLDRTFAALADPTRRALLARLGQQDSISVSELAQPFAMSLPAVMKHLDVLSDAGLVTRIIIRFEGFVGRYAWHCHVLEHEANEMMRPYEVLAPA